MCARPRPRPSSVVLGKPATLHGRSNNRGRGRWTRTSTNFARIFLGFLICCCICTSFAENRVIIISPHNEAIRLEFARAFEQWHRQTYGEPATVEWRSVGGSSDALKFVLSEFSRKPEGIGIDCFFGGGEEPFLFLSDKKLLTRLDRKSTRLNSSHSRASRMPSSA